MAASTWRMNGLYRRIAGVLLLWILLLSSEVICQDDATESPAPVTGAGDPATNPGTSAAPDADSSGTVKDAEQSVASSAAPADKLFTVNTVVIPGHGQDKGTSQTPAADADAAEGDVVDTEAKPAATAPVIVVIVPEVTCVAKEEISEISALKAEVSTNDCEATKSIIQGNPAAWCNLENCNIEIFQEEKTLYMTSKDADLGTLADALQSENLKDKLGVTKTETPSSSGSSVFVGILVSGLLAAIAITVGYFKCKRRGDTKGVKLAEEAYPVDPENQANTLVSDAPLNPPTETQEKPSVNGESPEAAKTQTPPPTNGHSTAKTADTEL